MPKSSSVGRPISTPPKGFVSVSTAAERRNVSYSVAYRHVKNNEVRWQQDRQSGVLYIDERDLPKISKHEPPKDRVRIVVQLSPTPKRHKAWRDVAKRQDMTVTELAYQLLDKCVELSTK